MNNFLQNANIGIFADSIKFLCVFLLVTVRPYQTNLWFGKNACIYIDFSTFAS